LAAKDRARGKAFELWVGRKFGGRRRTNGERGGFDDCVPVEGGLLPVSLECKTYATLQLRPVWIEQAIRNAAGRPWAVVQRPKGSRRVYATVDLEWLVELCECAGLIAHQTVREEFDDQGVRP
jgi:hypothetical protein